MESLAKINNSLTNENIECLSALKKWLNVDAPFKGRNDNDFLLMFLRSCEFDVELTKKSMQIYYKNRIRFPLWWSNRDVRNSSLREILNSNFGTALIRTCLNKPIVFISRLSKLGTDSRKCNDILKLASIMGDVCVRRPDCQLNGGIILIDVQNCPSWYYYQVSWPPFARNVIQAFVSSMPIRVNKLVFINCSTLHIATMKTLLFFLPHHINQKISCYGSDWSELNEIVPIELLPEEYGGQAGPFQLHQDAFNKEIILFNDYLLDDNKYGFQSQTPQNGEI